MEGNEINTNLWDGRFKQTILKQAVCLNITENDSYSVQKQINIPQSRHLDFIIYPCSKPSGCYRNLNKFKGLKLVVPKAVTTFDPTRMDNPLGTFISRDETFSFDMK